MIDPLATTVSHCIMTQSSVGHKYDNDVCHSKLGFWVVSGVKVRLVSLRTDVIEPKKHKI